jgi:hypothetical protein
MKVPASTWNKMVDFIFRRRVRSVLALDTGDWRHPWHTSCDWNAQEERWEATVKPGFVNGRDVTVQIEAEQLLDSGETIVEPSLNNSSATVQLPLTASPSIPLTTFRHLTASAPAFFALLGVKSITAPTADQLDQGITDIISGLPDDPLSERQLKACDIVLRCTRPRTTIEWQITPAETGAQAQFTVGSSGSSSSSPSLRVSASFNPLTPTDDLTKLQGGYEDPGYDDFKVCTVFFLSPPGASVDAEVDQTWQPHVRHDLFWNARYTISQPVSADPQNITLNLAGLGSAAGAQLTVNQLLSQSNDAFAAALQFLASREITGTLSTPGTPENQKWDKLADLDPPFPYVGVPG